MHRKVLFKEPKCTLLLLLGAKCILKGPLGSQNECHIALQGAIMESKDLSWELKHIPKGLLEPKLMLRFCLGESGSQNK